MANRRAASAYVFCHCTKFFNPSRCEWIAIKAHSAQVIDDDFQIGNAVCDIGSVFKGVFTNKYVDSFPSSGCLFEVSKEFSG